MAWQRSGDTGATYPPLMAVRGDAAADERTINEVGGFLWRLSMQSGAHLTDYVLDIGTVEMIGGKRTDELIRLCLWQGLLTEHRTERGIGYRIIEDPDFIHLRSRAEVERERQQRNDTRPESGLVVPVRRRDGDNCRWCGVEVIWPGRKTQRSGELDHLRPDQLDDGVPTTVDLLIVACRRCNRARGGNRAEWDASHVLRPAPEHPRYGAWTAQFLTENGYPTEPTPSDSSRPAPAISADPAAPVQRPVVRPSDDPATGAGGTPSELPGISTSRSDATGSAGSGRDGSGSGRVGKGSGREGAGLGGGGAPPGPRRRSRGRRGRNRSGQQHQDRGDA